MRIQKMIPVCQILLDRTPINQSTLNLVDFLRMATPFRLKHFPPIHVVPTGTGQYRILDGRHRVTAFRLLGWKTILARFSDVKPSYCAFKLEGRQPDAITTQK